MLTHVRGHALDQVVFLLLPLGLSEHFLHLAFSTLVGFEQIGVDMGWLLGGLRREGF